MLYSVLHAGNIDKAFRFNTHIAQNEPGIKAVIIKLATVFFIHIFKQFTAEGVNPGAMLVAVVHQHLSDLIHTLPSKGFVAGGGIIFELDVQQQIRIVLHMIQQFPQLGEVMQIDIVISR